MTMSTAKTQRYVAYYRVSTAKQGRSGLGLEAQKQAVSEYISGKPSKLVAEYCDIESGKKNDRPELAKAMKMAKVTNSILIVAKLDRLSRNVAFLAQLMESRVKFICADMPDVTHFTVHVLAAVAQHEREAISDRTRKALASVKSRTPTDLRMLKKKPIGNPNGARDLLPHVRRASKLGSAALKARADENAADVAPIIADIRAAGITTLVGIAAELAARDVQTPRGGHWTASAVRRALARL